MTDFNRLNCQISGVGACGPGFANWPELIPYLNGEKPFCEQFSPPKPQVIPSNERRRAPLPVKLAIETSQQALDMAGLASKEVACVFGSGLGDMQITDYLCRALNTEEKQLSPTKFHNSVHNASAGYWTISTHCMQPANSIAASQYTAAIAILESLSQCLIEQVPVLITLFDIPSTLAISPVVDNPYPCSVSVLIQPLSHSTAQNPSSLAAQTANILSAKILQGECQWPPLQHATLQEVYRHNPAAKLLLLLENMIDGNCAPRHIPLSPSSTLEFSLKTV